MEVVVVVVVSVGDFGCDFGGPSILMRLSADGGRELTKKKNLTKTITT